MALLRFGQRGKQTGTAKRRFRRLGMEQLETREMLSVNIVFNYSLDNGFFTTSRRAALESVGAEFSSRLNDTLDPISSSTYNLYKPSNINSRVSVTTSVGANQIVVYAAGANLTGNTVGKGGPSYSSNHRGEGANDLRQTSASSISITMGPPPGTLPAATQISNPSRGMS